MSRAYIGVFTDEHDVMAAVSECREAGFEIHDVHAPYAVHGLDRAMGLRPSRLTWVCFVAGALAFSFAMWGQWWTSSVDWPLNIGGKSAAPIPAFVPILFEFTVLTAGLTTMLALFVRSRLYPGKRAKVPAPRITDDRFALVLAQRDSAFDHGKARTIFEKHNACDVLDVGGES